MRYFGASRSRNDYDFAIIGIPFDEKSSYLAGASRGPTAIREASSEAKVNSWTELGIDLADISLTDLGDVEVSADFVKTSANIERRVLQVLNRQAVPIFLGGDHSITYPVMKAFAQKVGHIDILQFDAHPDLYDEYQGDPYSHACPFARIIDEGLADRIVQVGIRAATSAQRKKASASEVEMIEMKNFHHGLVLDFDNPVYISFDLDVLDPGFAPGVAHREPGGLSTRQVITLIHGLQANIIGMDIVELNPTRDISGITADAAVKIIKEVLGRIVDLRNKESA